MITVYKYSFEINDTVNLEIQGFIRCLKVGNNQHGFNERNTSNLQGKLLLWAQVDTEIQQYTPVSFEIRGTGHDCSDLSKHIDTVFQDPFVWHIFVKQAYEWQWNSSL